MNLFLEEISNDLTPIERAVLRQANPLDALELQSLLETYPELSELDVRVPHLSNLAFQLAAEHGIQLESRTNITAQNAFVPVLGALQPDAKTRFAVGETLGSPPIDPSPHAASPSFSSVDLRRCNWPVRDQNPRGTCVAFAVTACQEIKQPQLMDLSEQFLYWVIKDHHDGQPNLEGTKMRYAADALLQDGICTEVLCPYSAEHISSGEFQGGPRPSHEAFADAGRRTTTSVHHEGGTAAAIHASIAEGTPVALSLPVFASASNANRHNWITSIALERGVVLTPPPTAAIVGGHAICVTGFVPDPAEPNGGYFVIRNSWGASWGSLGTTTDARNPEAGYGSVSATYVELYTWEWLQV